MIYLTVVLFVISIFIQQLTINRLGKQIAIKDKSLKILEDTLAQLTRHL